MTITLQEAKAKGHLWVAKYAPQPKPQTNPVDPFPERTARREYSRGYSAGLRNLPFSKLRHTPQADKGWSAAQARFVRDGDKSDVWRTPQ